MAVRASAPAALPRLRRPDTDPGSGLHSVKGIRGPLVGREQQLAAMREALARAVDFQAPQVITIVGNQGTGKSRLVAEWIHLHVKEPCRVFHGRATSRGASPTARFEAITTLLRDRFGIADGDTSEAARQTFQREVCRVFGEDRLPEVLHFLGGFLDLSFPVSPFLRVLNENPTQHDEIARTVLRRFIEVDADQSPLVLVFDDLQWADDDTLTALRELGAGLGGSSVVVVACCRPEMLVRCAEWGAGATDNERIELRNLSAVDAERMLGNLLSRCESVPREIVEDAVEMTGGNPYFIEQLVRLFLANGTIDSRLPTWTIDVDKAAETELPISIEEAIEARIAALSRLEREVLERGAVFGSVFWLSAVVAMSRIEQAAAVNPAGGKPDRALTPIEPLGYHWHAEDEPVRRRLTEVVESLVERDYLLMLDPEGSTIIGDVELVFKHNLERELIVKSTEALRHARYHRLAAQWLETRLSGRSEEQLESLAQLYERGGNQRRAATCYLQGGDMARARYGNEEAVRFYQRGLSMLEDDDALARLDALHNLGDVLALVGDMEGAVEHFTLMLRHAWMYDNPAKAGAAHSRLARIGRRQGDYDLAMTHLREANQLFARASDSRGIAGTLDDMGTVHWLRGAYGQALDFHRQALSIRRALGDRRSIALSLANIGRVHHDSGGFKAAIQQFREALDLRRDIGDLVGVVQSLCDLGGVHSADGSHEMALELLTEANKLAVEIGDRVAQADVLSRIGECKSAMGRGGEAIAHLEQAIGFASDLGDRVVISECRRRLAEVLISIGDLAGADSGARVALAIAEGIGSRVHIGSAHRVLGEINAARGDAPGARGVAEDHFNRSVDILAGMKNELELARCYRSFALFRDSCGLGEDAAKLRKRADEIYSRLRGAAATE